MRKRLFAGAVGLIAAGVAWLVAQGGQPNSLASLFPGGALVYVEARDLSAILRDWNASSEKRLWLASSNHDVFSRTRLFLRLAEAQQEFADTAGFAPDMSLVNSISGGQSAVAVYDIGELEFLYVTRLPSARILGSTPFAARSSYEARESAGQPYYVRSGTNKRVAAFGTVGDLLFLATRGDLVANALALYARQQAVTPLAQDRWFDTLSKTAANPGDVRIALNMPGLLKTPYFRSYWIQRNASELRPFSAGIIDLFREPRQIREERILIRAESATRPSEQPVAQVIAWVPTDAGLYRAWAAPSTDRVLHLLRSKLVAPGVGDTPQSRSAPALADPDAVVGNAADLETRIDQRALEASAGDPVAPLRPIIDSARVQAMLHVQGSQPAPDGVFLRNQTAIALLASTDWPVMSLDGVAAHRQGRILVLASDAAMLQRIVAQLGAPPSATSAVYAARCLHSRELAPFTRMMTQMDAGNGQQDDPEPRFFSQNVASLGRVLERVESQSIVVHDEETRVTQRVVYALKP